MNTCMVAESLNLTRHMVTFPGAYCAVRCDARRGSTLYSFFILPIQENLHFRLKIRKNFHDAMIFACAIRFSWLFILFFVHKAEADCVGDTATYNESGLVVPFKNLCNQDISASVDFSDPSNEPSRAQCISRCVQKAPLCYGLDYVEDGSSSFNCWLMSGYFTETQTTASRSVNAAMLSSEFRAALSGECIQLGIYGCWKKNGRVGTAVASSSVVSLPSTSTTSSPSAAPSVGTGGNLDSTSASSSAGSLSTGAKAGIGAGVGLAALLGIIALVVLLLRRHKKSNDSVQQVTRFDEQRPTEKYAGRSDFDGMSELPARDNEHGRAELESPEPIISRSGDSGFPVSSRR